jgi:hypothetical protein
MLDELRQGQCSIVESVLRVEVVSRNVVEWMDLSPIAIASGRCLFSRALRNAHTNNPAVLFGASWYWYNYRVRVRSGYQLELIVSYGRCPRDARRFLTPFIDDPSLFRYRIVKRLRLEYHPHAFRRLCM